MLSGSCSEGAGMKQSALRVRAVLLEFLKFRVLAAQQEFFRQTESGPARRSWLATHHHEALQLGDADLDRVWNQARTLYTED